MEREPFNFVIDAANVAYSGQNYHDGQFSFDQIEFVYDELIRQFGPKTRPLIIIPESYTQECRFNSISRSTTIRSAEDEKIIERFKRLEAIYSCPNPTGFVEYDDILILYATLFNPNRFRDPVIAITNDLMRNHAVNSFRDLKLFYRWRKTQVANYTLILDSNTLKKSNPNNRLVIQLPGRHHNEIQLSPTTGHWHIPIIDRNDTWLCFALKKPDNSSSIMDFDGDVSAENEDDEEKNYEWKGDAEENS